jgi:hypothetical protein
MFLAAAAWAGFVTANLGVWTLDLGISTITVRTG